MSEQKPGEGQAATQAAMNRTISELRIRPMSVASPVLSVYCGLGRPEKQPRSSDPSPLIPVTLKAHFPYALKLSLSLSTSTQFL